MSSYTWVAEAPVAAGRRFRGWSTDVGRWLRADVRDVVRIEADDRSAAVVTPQALMTGLGRWRARVDRHRAGAVARRWLVAALAIGVAVEAVGLATGASTTTRAVALAAPALVWLAGVAYGVRRGRPGVADVARLLDHDLALAEVVSTALELEERPSSDREQPLGCGLPVLVLAQGSAAVARSLGSARIAATSWRPEWLASLVLAGVVALLVTLPGSGTGAVSRGGVARHRGAVSESGGGGRSATQPTAGSTVRRHNPSPSGPAELSRSTAVARLRLGKGNGNGAAPPPAGASVVRGRSVAKATAGSTSHPSAGSTSHPPVGLGGRAAAPGPEGGQSGGAGQSGKAGHSQGAARALPGSRSSVPTGQASSGARAASRPSPGASARRAAAGAARPHAGRAGSPQAQGEPGAASSKAPAALASRHGAPGGESAGRGRGSTAAGPPELAPPPGQSATGLPIQAGYAPTAGESVRTGRGPAVTGGRGPAPSATVAGAAAAAAATAGGTSFPYIPPTPGLPPSLDLGPVLSYFGPFSWLLSATW